MEKGFVKELNFREITREGQANNLLVNLTRIDGITADIKLFSNNFSNTSRIPNIDFNGDDIYVTELDSDGEWVVVLDVNGVADGYVSYSNRTLLYEEEIQPDGTSLGRRAFTQAEEDEIVAAQAAARGDVVGREIRFTVYESNTVDRFKVRDQYGFNRKPQYTLIRPDAITAKNIRNMAVDREPTITDSINVDDIGDGGANLNTGYISAPISSNYAEIDNGLAMYTYKKSRLPLGYEPSLLTKRSTINGYINISNPNNVSVINPDLDPPGLYIRPPTGGAPIRAFSDTSNPWIRINNPNNKLETTAVKITVQSLSASNPNLRPSDEAQQPKSENNNLEGTRYKIPAIIDGVPYFLFAIE